MKKLLQTYEHLIISGVILIICVAGFVFGIIPSALKIADELGQLSTLTQERDGLKQKLSYLQSLDESTLRDQLLTALSAVPADKSIPTVFNTVESLAAQSGVSVDKMQVSAGGYIATASATKQTPVERQLGTRLVPFTVTIVGTFTGIEQFISEAPTIRRILRIRTFAISFPKTTNTISVVLNMDAFYEPFPTTLGVAAEAVTPLTDAEQVTLEKIANLTLLTDQTSAILPSPVTEKAKDNPFAP